MRVGFEEVTGTQQGCATATMVCNNMWGVLVDIHHWDGLVLTAITLQLSHILHVPQAETYLRHMQ